MIKQVILSNLNNKVRCHSYQNAVKLITLNSIYASRLKFSTTGLDKDLQNVSSINEKNFEQFKHHSRDWWDNTGKRKALHTMNLVRVPFIRDGLAKINNGALALEKMKILDVGCGGGILTEALGNICANVTGIDPSVILIKIAKDHLKVNQDISQNVTYLTDTIEDHSAKNPEKYDAVILSEVIEHVNGQEAFLKKCINAVKPGGSIFLSTFNRTIQSYLWGILLLENLYPIIPKGTHEWRMFITPEETQKIFEKYNCKVIQQNGLMYYPWNNTWSFSKSAQVTYIQHAIKN